VAFDSKHGDDDGRLDASRNLTGGASGMGRATVKRFIAEGARVVIGDVQSEPGVASRANSATRRDSS